MSDKCNEVQVLISKEPTVAGRVAAHVADLEDELALLKQLDHPNIVRYLVSLPPHPAFITHCIHQNYLSSESKHVICIDYTEYGQQQFLF